MVNPSALGRRKGSTDRVKLPISLTYVAYASFVVSIVILMTFGFILWPNSKLHHHHGLRVADDPQRIVNSGRIHRDKVHNDTSKISISRHVKEHEKFEDIWDAIVGAKVHLVSLSIPKSTELVKSSSYRGIEASFCKLKWKLYKEDPPSYSFFKVLMEASGCNNQKNWITVDLDTALKKTKEYDKLMEEKQNGNEGDINGRVHVLPPSGFVFHESRVGSTLAANSLTAMDPSGHRVYSESTPSIAALRACDKIVKSRCDVDANVQLFRDVVYLMGRSKLPDEKRMFFKIQSIGVKSIEIVLKAFPSVPWIFIYRDPVQTMMSHLDPSKGVKSNAVCLRYKSRPPPDLQQLVSSNGRDLRSLSNAEFCAAHLASLCENALNAMKTFPNGRAVNYEDLVNKLLHDTIPNHFGLEMDDESRQRVLDVSATYSKPEKKNPFGKVEKKSAKIWVEDSAKKENLATKEIREASDLFLMKSYNDLLTYN